MLMDLDEESKIFSNDPIKLRNYVGREVEVKTKGNLNFQGIVYTIDPVSESVVLTTEDGKGNTTLQLILGHLITSIDKLKDIKADVELFKETEIIKSEGVDENAMIRLKTWLESNLVPVEEEGVKLKCCSILTILPPYTPDSCLSTNEIVLSNVQRLIKSMPPN